MENKNIENEGELNNSPDEVRSVSDIKLSLNNYTSGKNAIRNVENTQEAAVDDYEKKGGIEEGVIENISNNSGLSENGIEENTIKNISNNINAESEAIDQNEGHDNPGKTPAFVRKDKNKKDLPLHIIGFVFLLLIVGFIIYYFFFNKKEETVIKEETNYSQQIIKSSFAAMKDLSAYNFDGKFSIS